jgi:CheY-like chemotaxis protein
MAASILIAEDDLAFRDTLEDALLDDGHEVLTARNGSEALGLLHRLAAPALVLLDLHMPVMDGVAFLAKLRERPDREGYQVVIMSAMVDIQWFDRAPGVLKAMRKPFDIDEILTLAKEFRYRRSRERSGSSNGSGGERAS